MYSSNTIPLIIWLLSSASIVVNGGGCTMKNIVNSNKSTKGFSKQKRCTQLSDLCADGSMPKKAHFACTEFFVSDCSDDTKEKNVIKLLMRQLATEAPPTGPPSPTLPEPPTRPTGPPSPPTGPPSPPTVSPTEPPPTEPPSESCTELCKDERDKSDPIPADIDVDTWKNIVSSYISDDDEGARAKYGNNINCWDTSHVESFDRAFEGQALFNEPLDCWDVSSAQEMYGMFVGASTFNQDLSTWMLDMVTTFSGMFYEASSFNQDINEWDVSKATNFEAMFEIADAFNQDISEWDVRKGTDFTSMFFGATAFNQNLCNWEFLNTPSTTNMFDSSGCFTKDDPSIDEACHVCEERRLGSNNNNNNDDNNHNHNNNNILQEDGLVLGAGAGTDDDITAFAPLEMVDDNIHQATDDDSPVTVQQTHRRW